MVNIVLSFDDGRHDNYEAYKNILNPLNIPATFNITVGYVLNDIEKKDVPGPHKPMSIEEVAEMNESSICEIAGHGYTHDNTIKSLIKGIEWQRENLGYDFVGIASPHSEYDLKKLEEDIKVFRDNNVVYLRVSNDYSKLKGFDEIQGAKRAIIRPEFVKLSKYGKLQQYNSAAEEGYVEDILFRGNHLDVTVNIGGTMITGEWSLEKEPLQVGEKVHVLIYRIYAVDDEKTYLCENKGMRDDDVFYI